MRRLKPRPNIFCSLEALEWRAMLNATPAQIASALDLPNGTLVTVDGDARSVSTRSNASFGGLLGFPTGFDTDFMIVSTGIADEVDSLPNDRVDQHGTDLGAPGLAGDSTSTFFTLTVTPRGDGRAQYFAFDVMIMTDEEVDAFGDFPDDGGVFVNGVDITDTGDVDVGTDMDPSLPTTGTFFNTRTVQYTFRYKIPLGVTTLNIELNLRDEGDGAVDSAILADHVRIEQPQVVYLNFDGQDVGDFFGHGTSMQVQSFEATDLGSLDTRANYISQIKAAVELVYAPYNAFFVLTPPSEGEYSEIVIGGSNSDQLAIDPLKQPFAAFEFDTGNGANASIHDWLDLGANTVYGRAEGVDIGNRNQHDRAVVFSGEFGAFGAQAVGGVAVTICHELGHLLGLRHVNDVATDLEVMRRGATNPAAVFNDLSFGLAELTWADGATQQNSNTYLGSLLGKTVGDFSRVEGTTSGASAEDFYKFQPEGNKAIFDVTITIFDAEDADAGASTFHFSSVVGAINLPLPVEFKDPRLVVLGASRLGGPINITTGTPGGGNNFRYRDTKVPLRGTDLEIVPELTLSEGAAVDGFTPFTIVSITDSPFNAIAFVTGNKGVFTDTDGDVITISLSGPGSLATVADGDVLSAQLILDGTTSKSALTIKVKKVTGDGRSFMLGVAGGTLKSLTASVTDFNGTGLVFAGLVGSVKIGDLTGGAAARFSTGGPPAIGSKMTFVARTIGAGSTFSFPGLVSTFTSGVIDGADLHMGVLGTFKALNISDSSIEADGADAKGVSVKSLKAAVVDGLALTALGSIGAISAVTWLGFGSVDAASIGTMTLSGDKKSNTAGDLTGSILLTDTLVAKAMKKLTVKGVFHDGAIVIRGNAGDFAFGGIVGAGVGIGIPLSLEEFSQFGDQGFPVSDDGVFTGGQGAMGSLTVAKPSATSGFSAVSPNLSHYGVVARSIGKLNLFVGFADGFNNGVPLGIATTFINSVTVARADRKFSTTKLDAAKLVTLVTGDPNLIINDQPDFVDFGIDADAGTSLIDAVLRLYRV